MGSETPSGARALRACLHRLHACHTCLVWGPWKLRLMQLMPLLGSRQMFGSTEATENGRGPAEASGKCSPGAKIDPGLSPVPLVPHSVDVAITALGVRCGPGVWAGDALDNREGGDDCEGIRSCLLTDLADLEGLLFSGAPAALPVRGLGASSALSLSTLLMLGSSEGLGPSRGGSITPENRSTIALSQLWVRGTSMHASPSPHVRK